MFGIRWFGSSAVLVITAADWLEPRPTVQSVLQSPPSLAHRCRLRIHHSRQLQCTHRNLLRIHDKLHRLPIKERIWYELAVSVSKLNVYLYSTLSQSATNVLPLPIRRCWSLQASPPARHSVKTARPWIWASVSRDIPVFSPRFRFRRVLIPA